MAGNRVRRGRAAAAACLTAALAAPAVFGQGGDPEFSVASFKRVAYSGARERLELNPGTVRCTCRLGLLIPYAWGLELWQLVGPSVPWFKKEFYQLAANLPEGATRDQIPGMLRQLLVERLNISVHWEDRETPVYALVVGKGGLKLKRPGEPGAPAISQPHSAMGANGQIHYEAVVPLRNFAGYLSAVMDRRVIDETGTEGKFEIVLDAAVPPKPLPIMVGRGPAEPGPDPLAPGGAVGDNGPSIFSAIQRLGLKLEPTKRPLKYLVVDKIDRDPAEN
jgi:uncharacterized protein (TIGR03435 family)